MLPIPNLIVCHKLYEEPGFVLDNILNGIFPRELYLKPYSFLECDFNITSFGILGYNSNICSIVNPAAICCLIALDKLMLLSKYLPFDLYISVSCLKGLEFFDIINKNMKI